MNTTTNIHDNLFGNIPYVAPEIFRADSSAGQNPYTKYSDIYSLGVLFWQISSGKSPFENQAHYVIITKVMTGIKENKIPDTPDEYYNLYTGCWDDEPNERYTIEYIYDVLVRLLKNDKHIDCNDHDSENKNECKFNNQISNSLIKLLS